MNNDGFDRVLVRDSSTSNNSDGALYVKDATEAHRKKFKVTRKGLLGYVRRREVYSPELSLQV